MRAYRHYVLQLRDLARGDGSQADVDAALDGEPKRRLREIVPLSQIKKSGAFFTGHALASKLMSSSPVSCTSSPEVVDPACGTGDLLVAAARRFHLGRDLGTTLDQWGDRLIGYDLHEEFIEATKWRLALLARARLRIIGRRRWNEVMPQLNQLFPQVRVANGITQLRNESGKRHFLINPPYTRTRARAECLWGSGSINHAALFIDECVKNASPGARISAILPDVLRAGRRYERWRKAISGKMDLDVIKPAGIFDSQTDVDVFILHGRIREASSIKSNWNYSSRAAFRVGDFFTIRVGPYVPFREHGMGQWHPYADVAALPHWDRVHSINTYVRFRGTVTPPPFVAVRRTSSPHDGHRAIGSIITGQESIAAENHLIILSPRDGLFRTCKQLLEVLRSPKTTTWINRRNRCRHLTVPLLAALPWWETL